MAPSVPVMRWLKHRLHEGVLMVLTTSYKVIVRTPLFLMTSKDAERAHEVGIMLLQLIGRSWVLSLVFSWLCCVRDERLAQYINGMHLPTPVGLAAGFDKYIQAVPGLATLGLCPIEVGGITPLAQPGNPRPRMFRIPGLGGLVNRMKFNNPGADEASRRLARLERLDIPLMVNIGIGANTPLEQASEDYCHVIARVVRYENVNIVVLNISSPNTPGLRRLQELGFLSDLLARIEFAVHELEREYHLSPVQIAVKLSPDLTDEQFETAVKACERNNVDILILCNTSTEIKKALGIVEEGGYSGPELLELMLKRVRRAYKLVGERMIIVGVGGISNARDAYQVLKAGAGFLQILTSLIYEGPFTPALINLGLLRLMERDGIVHISELRGTN